MLDTETINQLIGVSESFHASYKLMEIMKDPNSRNLLFDQFLRHETDLTFDWFTEYFQSEHSDRKGKKQDFTPDGAVKVASGVLGFSNSNADICAGTGGLTIKRYSVNPNAEFYCEEFSDRAIPFLLFNLAIRNINGTVCHGDSLTSEFKAIYKLSKSEKFSEIEVVDYAPNTHFDSVIMNPPYSLPWEPEQSYLSQSRFNQYETLAPKSKADFAFLLTGLDKLNESGTMSIMLPHGVLFRGSAEEKIRKKLIELNYLDAVIGLPEKIFFNTDIPTVVLVLKKNRQDTNILFIDASKRFTKRKNHNEIEQKHVDEILNTYHQRREIDKFSKNVNLSEMKDNDFNLNIPRYVDTFEVEEPAPLNEIADELLKINQQIKKAEHELYSMMSELHGTNPQTEKELKEFMEAFGKVIGIKDVTNSLGEGQLVLFD